ncbi:MAG: glutamate--tRNA ligase family protein [Candidatus Nanopelagicales bacterium]
MTVTRIAPSPSGWLHVGNAVNFLLTDWAAGPQGRIRLRIDDLGLAVADRHLADIFWAVGWLGIPLAGGPRDAADFVAHHRQGARLDRYRSAGGALGPEWVYACSCSRTDVARRPVTTPDPCRDLALPLEPGHTALRFRTADGPPPGPATANALAALGLTRAGIAAEMGDFVVWRRDDLPAYQLVSMIDDTDQGST